MQEPADSGLEWCLVIRLRGLVGAEHSSGGGWGIGSGSECGFDREVALWARSCSFSGRWRFVSDSVGLVAVVGDLVACSARAISQRRMGFVEATQ